MGQKHIEKIEGNEQPKLPRAELIDLIGKIYGKAPFLRDEHIKAIQEEDVVSLSDLAKHMLTKLDYDRKYRGPEEEVDAYMKENGFSWNELNSAHEKLLTWIASKK